MLRFGLIAAGAGVLSALLYLSVVLGQPSAMLLAYLAQLPLFAVALGMGGLAGATATGSAALVVSLIGGAIAGGLFLMWKATKEIHHNIQPDSHPDLFNRQKPTLTFGSAIAQILVLDLVFSTDSILTAVGMTDNLAIMVIAVIVSVTAMMVAADPLARFVNNNPTIVMLALSFLMIIGMTLIADAFGHHLPKGYIYAAMAFSTGVEILNMVARKRHTAARAKLGQAPAGH